MEGCTCAQQNPPPLRISIRLHDAGLMSVADSLAGHLQARGTQLSLTTCRIPGDMELASAVCGAP